MLAIVHYQTYTQMIDDLATFYRLHCNLNEVSVTALNHMHTEGENAKSFTNTTKDLDAQVHGLPLAVIAAASIGQSIPPMHAGSRYTSRRAAVSLCC